LQQALENKLQTVVQQICNVAATKGVNAKSETEVMLNFCSLI